MAFATDMPAAARRHFQAAESLAGGHRRDVAGYLFGLSAECAVKAMLFNCGMRPDHASRSGDPYFAHFPQLRTLLRDKLSGRASAPLVRLIEDDSFMNHWSVEMRYSHGRDIDDRWVLAWHADAKRVLEVMSQ